MDQFKLNSKLPLNSAVNIDEFVNPNQKTCLVCNKSFKFVCSVRRHVKAIHFLIRKYDCPQCDRKFSERTKLKEHFENKHQIPNSNLYPEIESKQSSLDHVTDKFS